METCFDNIIGVKGGCSATVGTSSLYIEDIGITPDECDFYINKQYQNGNELIQDKIRFASDLVSKLIANHFSASVITKSFIDSQLLGVPQDSLNLKAGIANNLGGISLSLINSQSYFNVFVNSISLQISVSQTVPVLVYDLISGTLLDTLNVVCVANKVSKLVVNKTYSSDKRKLDLIFVYNTTGLNSNTTLLSNYGCTTCNGFKYSNYFISATPVYLPIAGQKIRSALASTSHTFGLSVNYSIQCSIENWLCQIANLMALPILYKAGEEIMNYAAFYSTRQTSSVNIDAERNLKRLELYQKSFNEALEATIQKINLPKNDICFKCNEAVKHVIALP